MESKFEQIKTVASRNSQILVCGGAFNNAMRAMMKAEADYIDQKMKEEWLFRGDGGLKIPSTPVFIRLSDI